MYWTIQNKRTPLHVAALNSHNLTIETLIKFGAEVNAVEVVSYFVCVCFITLQQIVSYWATYLGSMDSITCSCRKWL